jgi:ABC-type phosphate transport system permease subunit
MKQKFILIAFSLLIISYTSSSAFAEIDFDSGPLHERPLDEREQEDKFTEEIWMYAIILVIILIIIRLVFRVMKKRMKPKKD